MRTKGMAIFVATQNIGAAFNQFVNPIALEAIGWRYYGVYLVVEAVYLVWMWFMFPETKRKTIEEVSVIFDKYGQENDPPAELPAMGLQQAQKASKQDTDHVELAHEEGMTKANVN